MIGIGIDFLRFNHWSTWPVIFPLVVVIIGGAWVLFQLIKIAGLFVGMPWSRW